uniref:RING-type domain-containing protein n=1 Tax=Timspurckia oligopyrenoides TaxID=708627 RepID=A0A7S1ES25_9RHOD|mmetsp:Transcript_4033/g.7078  ORF Transcript_4033/g.7078 Transcript_4033/m.7078 type:complete len:163 (+) Transcript_4033:147-635(+)
MLSVLSAIVAALLLLILYRYLLKRATQFSGTVAVFSGIPYSEVHINDNPQQQQPTTAPESIRFFHGFHETWRLLSLSTHVNMISNECYSKHGLSQKCIDSIPVCNSIDDSCKFGDECIICMTKYEKAELLRVLKCEHVYHRDCVDPWLRLSTQCPLCRQAAL